MNIAIDAFESTLNKKVGMGNYVDNLIRGLALIDSKNDYTLYIKNSSSNAACIIKHNFKYKKLTSPMIRSYWSQCRLPIEIFFKKPNILHVPTGHKIPFNSPVNTVVTIHDLAFIKFPEYFERSVKWRSLKFTQHAILKAKKIIAISESTKKDILKYYKVDDNKIDVIYHGVEDEFKPVKDKGKIDAACKKYGINSPFVLFVGVLQPRKNIKRLIWAFKKVLNSYDKNMQLVIAGNKGWMYDSIFESVKKAGIGDKVVFTGYTPKQDVISLLSAASVFVLPSLYEGFGMPVLEAMACGVPVITSNVSSMPEIVNDAAVLINPYCVDEISNAIIEVLSKPLLTEGLISKGLERVKDFSWEKAAMQTLRVYESMAGVEK